MNDKSAMQLPDVWACHQIKFLNQGFAASLSRGQVGREITVSEPSGQRGVDCLAGVIQRGIQAVIAAAGVAPRALGEPEAAPLGGGGIGGT